jgi:hypothetical protein
VISTWQAAIFRQHLTKPLPSRPAPLAMLWLYNRQRLVLLQGGHTLACSPAARPSHKAARSAAAPRPAATFAVRRRAAATSAALSSCHSPAAATCDRWQNRMRRLLIQYCTAACLFGAARWLPAQVDPAWEAHNLSMVNQQPASAQVAFAGSQDD